MLLTRVKSEPSTKPYLEAMRFAIQVFHAPLLLTNPDKCGAFGLAPGTAVEIFARLTEHRLECATFVAEKEMAKRLTGLRGGEKLIIRGTPCGAFAEELVVHIAEIVEVFPAEASL